MPMKNRILVWIALIIVIFSISLPLTKASTLNVALYPAQNLAKLTAVSDTVIKLNYPASSVPTSLSYMLNGYNRSFSINVTINKSSASLLYFEHDLKSYDSNITVQQINLTMNFSALANATTLTITKNLIITVLVSGIFNRTEHTIKANMEWKDFEISGEFYINYNGQKIDVNEVGTSMIEQMNEKSQVMSMLFEMFGNEKSIWNKGTIDYSALSEPLENWTKTYNPVTNTTNFYYNSYVVFHQQFLVNFNGQNYTLSISYDPSASITAPGNATASGNTLIIPITPISKQIQELRNWIMDNLYSLLIGTLIAMIIIIAGFFSIRKKS